MHTPEVYNLLTLVISGMLILLLIAGARVAHSTYRQFIRRPRFGLLSLFLATTAIALGLAFLRAVGFDLAVEPGLVFFVLLALGVGIFLALGVGIIIVGVVWLICCGFLERDEMRKLSQLGQRLREQDMNFEAQQKSGSRRAG
jgi:hypothetical protein